MSVRTVQFNSGPPSNFYIAPFWLPTPVQVDPYKQERKFKGVEWWFQSYKNAISHNPNKEDYLAIAYAPTAREAKRLGKLEELDEDQIRMWNGFQSVQVMLEGCLAKFWQDEKCNQWLLNTGSDHLVEHRPDKTWGDNMDGSGRNLLGLVLELVRATIK